MAARFNSSGSTSRVASVRSGARGRGRGCGHTQLVDLHHSRENSLLERVSLLDLVIKLIFLEEFDNFLVQAF